MVKKALLILGIIALFSSSAFAAQSAGRSFKITITIPEKPGISSKSLEKYSSQVVREGKVLTLCSLTTK